MRPHFSFLSASIWGCVSCSSVERRHWPIFMVQKPKRRVFLHHAFCTIVLQHVLRGFRRFRAQAAVEQKQGFMHPLNFYCVSSPHGENENIQHTGGGGI